MLDFMRDRNTAEARRQELLDAYLDNALTPAEKAQFEAQLAADVRLRAEVEQARALRMQLRAMPHRRVPRSFALNPAVYGRPKAQPLMQLYPVLRGATAVSAFLLIFVLALGLFRGQFGPGAGAPVGEVAMSEAADTAAQDAAPAEVAEEALVAEEPAEEAAAAEAASAVEMAVAPTEALAAPAPAGTLVPAPEADLALEAITEAPTEAAFAAEESLRTEAPTAAPTAGTVAEAMATAAPVEQATPAEQTRSLLPLQLGLGAVFVLLLILWLLARRARP